MGNKNTALLQSIEAALEEIRAQVRANGAQISEIRAEMRSGFGTTYLPLEQVWQVSATLFGGSAEEFGRLRATDTEVLKIYKEADGTNFPNFMKLERNKPPFVSASESKPKSMFPGTSGQTSLAHIVPDDPICSLTWGEAIALFSGKEATNMLKSPELRNFVRGNNGGASNPFKVWAWNYLQLPINHAQYFDNFKKEQAVIITPIWDSKEKWIPGKGYKLLVTATQEGYKWLLGSVPFNEAEHPWIGEASDCDYQTATNFLQLAVKALADLLNKSPVIQLVQEAHQNAENSNNDGQTPRVEKNKKIVGVKAALQSEYGDLSEIISGAFVDGTRSESTSGTNQSASPQHADTLVRKLISLMQAKQKMKRLGKEEGCKVHAPGTKERSGKLLTVDLGKFYEEEKMLIPDPYPVVVKAGVNFSKFHEILLLVGCNGIKEMDTSTSFSNGQGSVESNCSESAALTGEPGDAMMGEGYEEISPLTNCDETPVKVSAKSHIVTP
jgi:hypothetical protein